MRTIYRLGEGARKQLRLAQKNKMPSETDDLLEQMQMVAGACNGQYLEFPWTIAEIAPDKPTATTRV